MEADDREPAQPKPAFVPVLLRPMPPRKRPTWVAFWLVAAFHSTIFWQMCALLQAGCTEVDERAVCRPDNQTLLVMGPLTAAFIGLAILGLLTAYRTGRFFAAGLTIALVLPTVAFLIAAGAVAH